MHEENSVRPDLPEELPRGAEIPENLDPSAILDVKFDPDKDGMLMRHQNKWISDLSPLKICQKGRRTGITFAEALDDTLIASTKKSEGGSNIFYIGDTKDKGREFIDYCAHFARKVAKELVQVEEFMFKDINDEGDTKYISAYRIRFASGFRIEALSSRPENIRGLQGIVVIDEAAFHKDVREVIDAVNALLIWGGKVRIISSHNGSLNPFNELIQETLAGKNNYVLHTYTFKDAVKNGLYKRVCYIRGIEYSKQGEEEWEAEIRKSYGSRTAAMKQELDCIPADSEGAALTRVQIEKCQKEGIPVFRWSQPDEFKNAPDHIRTAEAKDFCNEFLRPILAKLDPFLQHFFGEDFARSGDLTALVVYALGKDMHRRQKMVVELRNIPFDQQREIVFFILDRLPRFSGGAFDARGNGQYLAEKARQKYGEMIHEVMLSTQWYQAEMPALIDAFGQETIEIPKDQDILQDLQSLQWVNGIVKVPEGHFHKGTDGQKRHGDVAIATALGYFATRQDTFEYGYGTIEDKEYREDQIKRDVKLTSGISAHKGMVG